MFDITLDGRKFTDVLHAPFVANQDDYVLAHLRLAGDVVKVFNDLDGVQRTKEQRADDLFTQILLSGRTYYILAGILIEEGKVWSRAEADANAARFAAITDVGEKTAMRSAIVKFFIGFFSLGEPSPETSRKPSNRSGKVPPTKNADPSTSGTSRR